MPTPNLFKRMRLLGRRELATLRLERDEARMEWKRVENDATIWMNAVCAKNEELRAEVAKLQVRNQQLRDVIDALRASGGVGP